MKQPMKCVSRVLQQQYFLAPHPYIAAQQTDLTDIRPFRRSGAPRPPCRRAVRCAPCRMVCLLPAISPPSSDSPVDALRSLCVPHEEAMDLVAASWFPPSPRRAIKPADVCGTCERDECGQYALVTTIDGGRCVAVLRLNNGRWAACYAYPEQAATSRVEAERRLRRLTHGKKRGLVAVAETGLPSVNADKASLQRPV